MTQPTPRPGTPASRDIVIGATVYGHDNTRFGSVAGSYRNYLIVERGFFMPVDYYVPMAAVERADRDLVVLTVSRDAALTQGWERPPFTSETGLRGPRQPAVGRPVAAPAAPGASAAGAGRQRAVGAETGPTSWPAATGSAAAMPSSVTGEDSAETPLAPSRDATSDAAPRQPDADVSAAAPKETTAISPAAAFADTYAVGTNTDSYQAMTDFAPPEPVPAATASPAPPSSPPVMAEQRDDVPVSSESAPSTTGSDATDSQPTSPVEPPTS